MQKMKIKQLSGAALDWAVAKCEDVYCFDGTYTPSTDWAAGGAIIERERISVLTCCGEWQADIEEGDRYYGATPLVAAMRCYVASKLGDEVQIPEELTDENAN